VLSKRGCNVGPKHTKILVTNLDEWMPRQVVSAYQRRWPVEQINRELKTDLGLGEHQVSREEGCIEKSFGSAVLAYVLLIRACHKEIRPGTSWSIAFEGIVSDQPLLRGIVVDNVVRIATVSL